MGTGYDGTYVIAWAQVAVSGGDAGDADANSPFAITEGMILSWSGQATRLDGPASVMRLGGALGQPELHARAGRAVRRLVGAREVGPAEDEAGTLPENSFMVSDGAERYTLVLIETGSPAGPLLLFEDGVAPTNTPLRVIRTRGEGAPVTRHSGVDGHMICFTQGTMIRTPGGARPVETLGCGDLVATKDSGAQVLRWVGWRHITGARMFAMPELRPVRIRAGALGGGRPDADLWVSPEHRMLLSGPNAQALFNTPEVLVSARDLINDRDIMVDHRLRETSYVHLLLEQQEVLWANGAETESFHPGTAALELMDPAQRRALLDLHPELGTDPMSYGDYARRVLSSCEAEILFRGHAAGH